MVKTIEIVVAPDRAEEMELLLQSSGRELGVPEGDITGIRLLRKSIDARQRPVVLRLQLEVWVGEPMPEEELIVPDYPEVQGTKRCVIVGAGPAGMFAALRLIEEGIRPIILERGKDVQARRRDLAAVQKLGKVNPDSNYCFGEGGAGTYSDGKLYTRSTKRGDVGYIYRTLVAHGATPAILTDAHPHIGSNKLPKVVAALRESILNAGGEIHFEQRVEEIVLDQARAARGVRTARGEEFLGESVILATGHSARDIFRLLDKQNILIESKPFAVGVRLEHPQPLIDRIQYHTETRPEGLPAARYRLAATVKERGVFSFCMCPGGFIVPAATEDDEVVVNGMSLSRRDSPFANSGIIVNIEPEDIADFDGGGALAGMRFQKALEVMTAQAGGGMQKAPAQRMTDFINGEMSATLPSTSYNPGVTSAPLHELLPERIAFRLQSGLKQFGKKMRGYLTEEALLVAIESRTSSPVKIPRDNATLQHPQVPNLFPCGEGGGYAGGIVSAALDGVRVANQISKQL
ncbi:MAG: FAD-dependent monooxygenase [Ignavibacteriae bacterium]|nr:FAD-dependent monooxygenase [Ignavibacteriota bacterium]MCB9215650.1 FAD-dependent monooxygenase [Ignavibacteria bacterium]